MTEDMTDPIAIPVITTKIAMSGQFCSFVLLVLRCFSHQKSRTKGSHHLQKLICLMKKYH